MIAVLEDFPDNGEPRFEVNTGSHDHVVHGAAGECVPHVLQSGAADECTSGRLSCRSASSMTIPVRPRSSTVVVVVDSSFD